MVKEICSDFKNLYNQVGLKLRIPREYFKPKNQTRRAALKEYQVVAYWPLTEPSIKDVPI